MHLNTYLTHEGTRYEIHWTTQAAQHILENYVADQTGGVHQGIDHRTVSQLLRRARYILLMYNDARADLYVCLTGRMGQVYETYVYLVAEQASRPPRCVVVSSYVSNKQAYRELFAT
jgi:hypothetical protein